MALNKVSKFRFFTSEKKVFDLSPMFFYSTKNPCAVDNSSFVTFSSSEFCFIYFNNPIVTTIFSVLDVIKLESISRMKLVQSVIVFLFTYNRDAAWLQSKLFSKSSFTSIITCLTDSFEFFSQVPE